MVDIATDDSTTFNDDSSAHLVLAGSEESFRGSRRRLEKSVIGRYGTLCLGSRWDPNLSGSKGKNFKVL